jgi:hypothetical protein
MKTKETSNKAIAEVYAFSEADRIVGRNKTYSDKWNKEYDKAYHSRLLELNQKKKEVHDKQFLAALSTRDQALVWWGDLTDTEKYKLDRDSHELRPGRGISWQNFTGREIEEIWKIKSNQKQSMFGSWDNLSKEELDIILPKRQKLYKKFDESLFRAYIDKFSDEDRYEMIRLLAESFKLNFEQTLGLIWLNR